MGNISIGSLGRGLELHIPLGNHQSHDFREKEWVAIGSIVKHPDVAESFETPGEAHKIQSLGEGPGRAVSRCCFPAKSRGYQSASGAKRASASR